MNVRSASLIAAVLIGFLAIPGAAFAQQWAAVDAHTTGTGPVVLAGDKTGAAAKAFAPCRRVSRTCSGMPATANLQGSSAYIFAYMCCTKPHLGCAITAATTKAQAAADAIRIGTNGGLDACAVRKYLSAKTGKTI